VHVSTLVTEQVRIPVNESATHMELELTYSPVTVTKWTRLYQLENTAKIVGNSKDLEQMKDFMTESSQWLLILVLIVAFSHFIFMFLRYKNDVSFWKSRDNFEGLSVQTIKVIGGRVWE
jgi:hypothetical protein